MFAKKMLEDGSYECHATLHIKDGTALVILHSMFGLPPGTTIPLTRKEHNLLVGESEVGEPGFVHGHTII
ncbi:MAG TPA: hypothetical protein VMC85_13020 [Desulfomonilaceae bacterium]|nr:hypothetical protein [Desulfomonilaceae bacterium]